MPASVIELTFRNHYSGRFAGERGMQTKTILRFFDERGKITRISDRIAKLQADELGTLTAIAERVAHIGHWMRLSIFLRRLKARYRLTEQIKRKTIHLLRKDSATTTVEVTQDLSATKFRRLRITGRP